MINTYILRDKLYQLDHPKPIIEDLDLYFLGETDAILEYKYPSIFDSLSSWPIVLTERFMRLFLCPCSLMFRFSIITIRSISKDTSICLESLIIVHFGMWFSMIWTMLRSPKKEGVSLIKTILGFMHKIRRRASFLLSSLLTAPSTLSILLSSLFYL